MFKCNNTNLSRIHHARSSHHKTSIYGLQIEYRAYLEKYRRVQNNSNELIRRADDIIKQNDKRAS